MTYILHRVFSSICGMGNNQIPCCCHCSVFYYFLWISLNCIDRWIHVSEPTVKSHHAPHTAFVSKMENRRWTDWIIKKVAFSVKSACMSSLCDGLSCLAAHGTAGCCIVYCSIADVNSVWGLDLRQTGRQSLSSPQPTSLSATLAVTKSIMFSLLCHFPHHGPLEIFLSIHFFSCRLSQLFLKLNGVVGLGNMPSKEEGVTYLSSG